MRVKDIHTDIQTHDNYCMSWGSTHQGIIWVSLGEPHINSPVWNIVSDYLTMYHIHAFVAPWFPRSAYALKCSVYSSIWRAHMSDLQLHSIEQEGRLELLIACQAIRVGYVHRRLSSTKSMWTIWVCAKLYYHTLTTFAMARDKAATFILEVSLEFQSILWYSWTLYLYIHIWFCRLCT